MVRLSDWTPSPNDPTPLNIIENCLADCSQKGSVEGRFHDNRHSFITDLAESGAPDDAIRDLAAHVSKDMLKHDSHIRMQPKRRAVGALESNHKCTGQEFKN